MEKQYLEPFLEYYLPIFCQNDQKISIECPDEDSSSRQPDFFLPDPNIAIELKGLHDEGITRLWADCGRIKNRLKRELGKLKLISLGNVFPIEIPIDFKLKRGQESLVAKQIFESLNKGDDNLSINGCEFIFKREGKEIELHFVIPTSVECPSPPDHIRKRMEKSISEANEQLNIPKTIKKRILLFVNNYDYGGIEEYREALRDIFILLEKYQNIDEIWLQLGKMHHILFSQKFLNDFMHKKINREEIEYNLLISFLPYLCHLAAKIKDKLLFQLKILLENKQGYEVFSDIRARVSIINLCDSLIETRQFDECQWLLSRFLYDPDEYVKGERFLFFAEKLAYFKGVT